MYINCIVCHFGYLHYVVSVHRLFQNYCRRQQHYTFMTTEWTVKLYFQKVQVCSKITFNAKPKNSASMVITWQCGRYQVFICDLPVLFSYMTHPRYVKKNFIWRGNVLDIRPRTLLVPRRETINCALWGTDNVHGQISEHISRQMEAIGFIVLQTFYTTRAVLKIREYHSDVPQF